MWWGSISVWSHVRCTDQLDVVTIARALLSGEARFGYVPSEQVATYRELMRLQKQRD